MKKYLALVLSMVFVLGFAASAFAIHATIPSETAAVGVQKGVEVSLGGELRIRGWYGDNAYSTTAGVLPMKKGNGTDQPNDIGPYSFYDQRVRLRLDVKRGPNVSGRIQLESEPENYTWGGSTTVANTNIKPTGTSLNFLEAWIAYTGKGLLGVPAGVKVGHMPIKIGEGVFLDHSKYGDDAILLFIEPAKGTEINLITAKLFEGATTPTVTSGSSDDVDMYIASITHKIDKDNTAGINYTLITSSDSAPHSAVTGENGMSFSNLGLHAKGKVAGLTYAAEFDTQFGKIKRPGATDTKFSGYGFMANLGYKVDIVNIRVGYAYGSGDNDATDNKNKEFQTSMGRDIHYSRIYEFTIRTAVAPVNAIGSQGQVIRFNGTGDAALRNTSIANTTYYNLGFDFEITKDLRAGIDGYIIRASKAYQAGQSKKVGTEVDARLSYRLGPGLTYFINGGVFTPGAFYTTGTTKLINEETTTQRKGTVTEVFHGLTLSF